jgi:hypothetical protein
MPNDKGVEVNKFIKDKFRALTPEEKIDQLQFWVIQAEMALEQVASCTNCGSCRKLAELYLQSAGNHPTH